MKPTSFYDFTVPANGVHRLLVAGDYFKLMTASGPMDVQAEWGELRGLQAGQGLEATPFSYLVFRDTSGAPNPARVFIGDEKFIDGLGGTVNIGTNAVPKSPAFLAQQKNVTNASAQLLAANVDRQYLLIQNNAASGDVYVSFGVAAVIGSAVRVVAGGNYELASVVPMSAIHAIGSVALNSDVVVVEG